MRELKITLRRRDYDDDLIQQYSKRILELIGKDENIFDAIVDLLTISVYWNADNFEKKYAKWSECVQSYQKMASKKSFNNLIKECNYTLCAQDKWDKFRGTLTEYIIERAFLNWFGTLKHLLVQDKSTGCAVFINGKPIKYCCLSTKEQQELCKRENKTCLVNGNCNVERQTVDIGVIYVKTKNKVLAYHTDLMEVKLIPNGFHYLDGGFLSYLNQRLNQEGILSKFHVATLGSHTLTETQVRERISLIEDITFWGIEDIKKWYFL